ncbi:SIS domain-containing protein [Paraburkholderia bonniea]|uniref:SIS domain-containing protein n=1 Tax=Paraburkholderia bonniea TaxID=2152891 RepID=UPI001291F6F2|nr:SIS domain-containing protein [Paraburkholderia bonniea]WJF89583.1 SIS domain-containing protein [Paraburkholderia bonniea]WJF92897.1 SIS domain-containing protein [Paraburkholderia bonniea]
MSAYTGVAETYLTKLSAMLATIDRKQIDDAIGVVADAWQQGRQIITLGNGGSSMTALHFITDWNKSVFMYGGGKPFRGRSLVDNMGLVMAYGNDISFEDIFIEQLKNILQPGDLVLAISGSGNSENVVRAVQYANDNGAVTLGLCGYRGGKLKELAQHVVWADIDDMQLAEDIHAIFGHMVMQKLCKQI